MTFKLREFFYFLFFDKTKKKPRSRKSTKSSLFPQEEDRRERLFHCAKVCLILFMEYFIILIFMLKAFLINHTIQNHFVIFQLFCLFRASHCIYRLQLHIRNRENLLCDVCLLRMYHTIIYNAPQALSINSVRVAFSALSVNFDTLQQNSNFPPFFLSVT